MSDDKVKVYKVYRQDCGAKHTVYTSWGEVESEFDGAEIDDRIIVMLGEMTPQAIKDLPDFEGW